MLSLVYEYMNQESLFDYLTLERKKYLVKYDNGNLIEEKIDSIENTTINIDKNCSKHTESSLVLDSGLEMWYGYWKSIDLLTRLQFAIDAARGIKCLHSHNIIHRDINTKNLLVTKYQYMVKYNGKCECGIIEAIWMRKIQHTGKQTIGAKMLEPRVQHKWQKQQLNQLHHNEKKLLLLHQW